MEPTTSAPSATLNELLSNRRTILAVKHWRAIPELCAEMTTTNREIRAAKRAQSRQTNAQPQAPAQNTLREPAPKLASEHWHKYETGDCVSHAQYGHGVVIRLEWSSALRSILYHVRYESGEIHAALAGDLQPREESNNG